MADEPAPTGDPAEPANPEPATKTFTQEQVNDLIAKEKGKIQAKYSDVDQLRAKASELDELKAASATDLEKVQGKLTKAETEATEARAKLLRFEVATEKQVPADALDLLVGNTREELEAKADKILELKGPAQSPEFDGGPREPAEDPKTPEQAHNETFLAALGLTPK